MTSERLLCMLFTSSSGKHRAVHEGSEPQNDAATLSLHVAEDDHYVFSKTIAEHRNGSISRR